MKKVKAQLFVVLVSALLFLANATAAFGANCAITSYQPEVPEALRK